jgi:hypothetical protein
MAEQGSPPWTQFDEKLAEYAAIWDTAEEEEIYPCGDTMPFGSASDEEEDDTCDEVTDLRLVIARNVIHLKNEEIALLHKELSLKNGLNKHYEETNRTLKRRLASMEDMIPKRYKCA